VSPNLRGSSSIVFDENQFAFRRRHDRLARSDWTLGPMNQGVFRTGDGWCACAWSSRGLSALVFNASLRARALASLKRLLPEGPGAQRGVPALYQKAVRAALAGRPFRHPRYDLSGRTPFERRVLRATLRLPRGEVASYGEVARRAGSPGAARAVGQVMHRNPIPLLIPCHRVTGAGGKLGGYTGGLDLKRILLKREGIRANYGRKFLYGRWML